MEMFQPNGEWECGIYDTDKSNLIPKKIGFSFLCLFLTKINHNMKTKLTSAPVQITPQVSILPLGYSEVTGIAYLGLSLSFMHLKGLSLSQSKIFLFLLSLFNENGRREEGCKSQRHFLLKSVSGTVQKTYLHSSYKSL